MNFLEQIFCMCLLYREVRHTLPCITPGALSEMVLRLLGISFFLTYVR